MKQVRTRTTTRFLLQDDETGYAYCSNCNTNRFRYNIYKKTLHCEICDFDHVKSSKESHHYHKTKRWISSEFAGNNGISGDKLKFYSLVEWEWI